ncbi:MAG TPA: ABC transporter permease [Holophagaceae bacterium]|nr:ABC transporter permease [Holophagaceae bacterium]
MTSFLHDLRYALRALLRAKGFTVAALVALALGIGANTAVFSLLQTTVLTPLPFKDPERVTTVWGNTAKRPNWTSSMAYPRLQEWRARNRTFEAMAGLDRVGMNLSGGDLPVRVEVGSVTSDFFKVIQVQPKLGRTLQPSDPEGAPIVVISEGLWQRTFGGDPAILDRKVNLDGQVYTVVGVLPATFAFLGRDAFVPHRPTETNRAHWGMNYLISFGRLKPGVSLAQARSDMASVCAALATEHPDTERERGALIRNYRDERYGAQQGVVTLLGVASGLVLLIACINVANQLLARATGRMRDMAVRSALGGGTLQVLAPSLAESLLVSLLGAAAGLLVAHLTLGLLTPLVPVDLAQTQPLSLHLPALAVTLLMALLTALLCGSTPGLILVRLNLSQSLKEGSKGSDSPGRKRIRNVLVVAQVALALMLAAGFSTAYLSIHRLLQVSVGFKSEGVSAFTVQPSLAKYPDDAQRRRVSQEILEATRHLPGVEAAAYIDLMPTVQSGRNGGFNLRSREGTENDIAEIRAISPGFFSLMGVPLRRGRDFGPADYGDTVQNIIINESLAAKCFPGQDPIGQEIGRGEQSWYRVVGVVGDIRNGGLRFDGNKDTMYFPDSETFSPTPLWILMKGGASGDGMLAAVRGALRQVDPDLPVMKVQTLDELVARGVRGERVQTMLLGLFAAIAAVLALLGIHSSMSYSVAQRTQEIGIRMSLGATPGQVMQQVVGEGLLLTGVGVALGLAGAFAFGKTLESLLYQVSPTDPLILAGTSLALLAMAALACLLPARRAAGLDPAVALRAE